VNMPPVEEAPDLAAAIASISSQHDATELVVIGYSVHVEAARELLTTVATDLDTDSLKDVIFVDGQRWWSLLCTGECCPANGQPYDPSSSPAAAEAVYAGLGARADRRALEAEVSGPPAEERDGLRLLAEQESAKIEQLDRQAQCRLMQSLVEAGLAAPERLDDQTCAQMAVLAAEVRVRDVAWSLITSEHAEEHLRIWARVVSRTTSPLEPAPLCLLGFSAWICGHGAMMNCCIERVGVIDPNYSMGRLLDKISRRAVPPTLWDGPGSEIPREGR
jgi:hypothetical protein